MDSSFFKVSFLCFFPFFLASNANNSQQEKFLKNWVLRFPKGILELTICDCEIIDAHGNDAGNLILTRSGSGRRADDGRALLEHMCLDARTPFFVRGPGLSRLPPTAFSAHRRISLYVFCASCPVPLLPGFSPARFLFPFLPQNRTWYTRKANTFNACCIYMGGLDQIIGPR